MRIERKITMPRLIDADALTSILQEWEEKACDGTENDGSDGTTRVLHPVSTSTSEMIDLIADQPTIEAVPASKVEELMLAMADMNAKFAEEKLAFLKVIKELAEYNPQWIPVTERLPEESGDLYIVTAYNEEIWCNRVVVLAAEFYRGSWTWNENGREWDLTDSVTHWMPMPEPPKADE